jgi:hypothetical protein
MQEELFQRHMTTAEIEQAIDNVLDSPKNNGQIEMLVRRPKVNKREVVESGMLDVENGLVGDNWLTRGSSRTTNGLGHPEMQLNLMNFRFLPIGARLSIGEAVIQVTAIPHLGCKKFVERFGMDAMMYANSEFGRKHNLRGINAKVISGGQVATGDCILVER